MPTVLAPIILIIDSERGIRQALRSLLRGEGFVSFDTGSTSVGMRLVRKQAPDLILFDINIPQREGLKLCRTLRLSFDGPLVVISALETERDKVLAFEAGADDYVVKPFGTQELLARIRVLLRRFGHQPAKIVETRDLCIDIESRLVTVRGRRVRLGPKEFEVLKVLVLANGKPVTHRNLLQVVWGRNIDYPQLVRVAIYELRRKIELKPSKPQFIFTDHRMGYRFILPEESQRRLRHMPD
jgi:two-component system, OmpR family, KDP operon response regulator KdpE